MHHSSHALAVAVLFTLASCVAVRPWRLDAPPLVAADIAEAEDARVLTAGGELVELHAVRWVEDARGPRLAGRRVVASERAGVEAEFAVDGLQRVETRRTETGRVLLNTVIGVGLTVVVVVGLVFLAASSITVVGG